VAANLLGLCAFIQTYAICNICLGPTPAATFSWGDTNLAAHLTVPLLRDFRIHTRPLIFLTLFKAHPAATFSWGDTNWRRTSWSRCSVIPEIMRGGFHVVWSDIDVVWFRDPTALLPLHPEVIDLLPSVTVNRQLSQRLLPRAQAAVWYAGRNK
jgi:Nucleotide-diphospho-sugar transferase